MKENFFRKCDNQKIRGLSIRNDFNELIIDYIVITFRVCVRDAWQIVEYAISSRAETWKMIEVRLPINFRRLDILAPSIGIAPVRIIRARGIGPRLDGEVSRCHV